MIANARIEQNKAKINLRNVGNNEFLISEDVLLAK